MKPTVLCGALVWICCFAFAPLLSAKGSHGGGGGHSSGGHAAAGGHAAGGHASGQTRSAATVRGSAAPRSTGTTSTPSAEPGRRVPHGQPIVGTAVPRTSTTSTPLAVFPSSYPLSRVWPYYGTALGLGGLGFYTDPLWSGYAYPDFAYGSAALWPDAGYAGLAPYPFDADGATGGLRLKVEPKQAQVYVDGYYAGIVDDFNGHFQHLDLTPGAHHVEIRDQLAFQPLAFDVVIQAHRTIEYRGVLSPSPQ